MKWQNKKNAMLVINVLFLKRIATALKRIVTTPKRINEDSPCTVLKTIVLKTIAVSQRR